MNTDPQTWFYTLSTIAQTCGAILALGGTFVIFKLQLLGEGIKNYRGRAQFILETYGHPQDRYKFFGKTDTKILHEYEEKLPEIQSSAAVIVACQQAFKGDFPFNDRDRQKEWFVDMGKFLRQNIRARGGIILNLETTTFLLVVSITGSIWFLPKSSLTASSDHNILALMVIWSSLSILYVGVSIVRIAGQSL